MNKKLISLLLAAVMIAMLLPVLAAADGAFPRPEGGKKFESDWAVAGGLTEIYYEEEGYRVTLTVENGDGAGAVWEIRLLLHGGYGFPAFLLLPPPELHRRPGYRRYGVRGCRL